MFKKGQLVKTIYGIGGVVVKESTVYPGSFIIRYLGQEGLTSSGYFKADEMRLIGNNFKFKGAK